MSELMSDVGNKINTVESTELGRRRIEYIREAITRQDWDSLLIDENGNTQDVLPLLLYEYGIGIERLTKGRCSLEKVIDKLVNTLGKLRLGPWREEDSNVIYARGFEDPDAMSVISDEYQQKTSNFGAHKCFYFDDDGKYKAALALLRIDFTNIEDLRHTLFHELTHVLGMSILNEQEFQDAGVLLTFVNNGRTFVNGEKTPNGQYIFNGVSSAEMLPNGDNVMHNMIDEGFTEGITKKIIEASGNPVVYTDRYKTEVDIAVLMIDALGTESIITNYFTRSHALKYNLETTTSGDVLHRVSSLLVDNKRSLEGIRALEEFLPEDVCKKLQKHKFFEHEEYSEETQVDVDDFKKRIINEILDACNQGHIDSKTTNIRRLKDSKLDDVDRYADSINGLKRMREAFSRIIEQKMQKGHEQDIDDKDEK